MKRRRRNRSSKFKARVALEALAHRQHKGPSAYPVDSTGAHM